MDILLGKKNHESWQKSIHDLLEPPIITGPSFLKVILDFLDEIAQAVFKEPAYGVYPDLMALGFWLRRANALSLIDSYMLPPSHNTHLKPRGLVLHFTPSNVDTMFMYSWVIGLLTQNRNIIRVSNRKGMVADILIKICSQILINQKYQDILNTNMIVSYDHHEEVTSFLSACCDVRVIWGGDASISAIRSIPIPAHAVEVTFANRFSLAMLKASAVTEAVADKKNFLNLLEGFVNDTFWFDQQGCSSPRAVVWVGSEKEILFAQEIFWPAINKLIKVKFPDFLEVISYPMKRFTFLAKITAQNTAQLLSHKDDCPLRVSVNKIDDELRKAHIGLGVFYETKVQNIKDLSSLFQKKDQTLTVFGFSQFELNELIQTINGVDRIVPIGKALAFSPTWDGYNLFHVMSRIVAREGTYE